MIRGRVHASIGDGGVTFEVVDEGRGPVIVISSSHFGNNQHTHKIAVTLDVLRELGQMFRSTASQEFSKQYVHAARIIPPDLRSLGDGDMDDIEDLLLQGDIDDILRQL
jgi:hypothetical protein